MSKDLYYMQYALEEAFKAYKEDEVPVGAVIVFEDKIIAKAHNQREKKQSTLSHAELEVIAIANKVLKSWKLDECTLYVTLEPCMMCLGAIQQARIKKLVYAAEDSKHGYTRYLKENKKLNYYPKIQSGILKEESEEMIKSYFKKKRKSNIIIKECPKSLIDQYFALREKVFVQEQNVSLEEEYDQYDEVSVDNVSHIVALISDVIVGTMRIIENKEEKSMHIGRLAVSKDYRDRKIGSRLLAYAEKQALHTGFDNLLLSAQINAQSFYEKNGYIAYGDVFLDANIEHIKMIKKIPAHE